MPVARQGSAMAPGRSGQSKEKMDFFVFRIGTKDAHMMRRFVHAGKLQPSKFRIVFFSSSRQPTEGKFLSLEIPCSACGRFRGGPGCRFQLCCWCREIRYWKSLACLWRRTMSLRMELPMGERQIVAVANEKIS